MPTFEDAMRKKWSAEESMKKQDWAEAIFHTQECIDLSIKAFLQALGIKYEPKHGLGEEPFVNAFERLKPKSEKEPKVEVKTFEELGRVVGSMISQDYEVRQTRALLAKAKVWMDLLAKVRGYAEGYTPLNVPTREIFDYGFEGFAKSAFDAVDSIRNNLENLARRLGLLTF